MPFGIYILEKLLVSQSRNSSLSTESELFLSSVQDPDTICETEVATIKCTALNS